MLKTQTRIALMFFLLTISIVAILSTAVYYFVTEYTFADFYKRLETRAALAARIKLEHESESTAAFQEIRDRVLEKLPNEIDYFIEITPGKDFKAESDSLRLPLSFFTDVADGAVSRAQHGDIFFAGVNYPRGDRTFIAIVSAENYYYSHHVASLRKILFIAFILMSLLVFLISFLFSRYAFNPIRQITKRVKDISTTNLHLRLSTSGPSDDVNELKITFNTMLDRLEASFATQNNFISNASHELSTPLTAIIGEADVALSKARVDEEYREALRAISGQAERLERITKSLLFLAKTGFDGLRQKFAPVRVDQLLWDVKETIERLNPRNKVQINAGLMPENPELLQVDGNEQLLHLAFTNIISNACKYSNHQPVDISIGISDNHLVTVISDKGIGIPNKELPFIYDPFFRASNTRDFEGYGIGLPLTRNIVRIHKGTIEVTSKLGQGTVVQLVFPIALTVSQ
ncbi:MAG TPA: ATP-binding protein [Cyclobacteriaceae bacterium]|nr:ATP-binding protein [Cyclobacteriaceae bacterium]